MRDLILGWHVAFAREGAVIDGITVAADAKPDADPESNWTRLATCEQLEPRHGKTFVERRAPSPGKFRTRTRIPLNQKLTINGQLQEWDEMALVELLFGGTKPVGGVFVPNGRADLVRGWFKLQAFAQDDLPVLTIDVWADCSIESYQFGEKLDPYALVIEVLASELNTGEVENLLG